MLATRSLLGALGVHSRRSGEASAAINWVVKDGVGKLSRLLFARWCGKPNAWLDSLVSDSLLWFASTDLHRHCTEYPLMS